MASAQGVRAGKAYVELGVKDTLQKALDAAGRRLAAFGQSLMRIGLATQAAGLAIITPLAGAVKAYADYASEIQDTADRTGLTTDALQELSHAANMSGTDMAGLEDGIRNLSRVMAEAAAGGDEAVQALQKLGLTVADLQRLSPDERFELIADRLSKIVDPGERAAAAMKVFGKSGTALLPLLKDGAAGIAALRKEAHDLGLVMSEENIAAGEQFGDVLATLWSQIKMVTAEVGAAVANALLPYADAFKNALAATVEWVRAHPGVIQAAAALGVALVGVGGVIVGVGAAAIALGFVLSNVMAIFGAVAAVAGVVFSPIGLGVGMALAALGGLVAYLLYTGGTLAWLKERFAELSTWGGMVLKGMSDALQAGDIQLAAEVLWGSLKVIWIKGTNDLSDIFDDFILHMMQSIQRLKQMFGASDPFGMIAIYGAADEILNRGARNAELEAAKKELDDLIRRARKEAENAKKPRGADQIPQAAAALDVTNGKVNGTIGTFNSAAVQSLVGSRSPIEIISRGQEALDRQVKKANEHLQSIRDDVKAAATLG